MGTDKQPSRDVADRPTKSRDEDARRNDRNENSLTYRENVDRVNRSREVEIERALSGVRR
jgi:hypothetical protein